MHKIAVIRSLSHPNANHVQAALPAMTGRHHPPGTESRGDFPPSPTDFPPDRRRARPPAAGRDLPTWVQIGPTMTRANFTVLHGQSPGFLGATHGPLLIDQDLTPDRVVVEAVAPDQGVSAARLGERRTLLERLDDRAPGARPRGGDPHARRLPAAGARPADRARRSSAPSTWPPSRPPSATRTAATRSARPACWPAGWPRPACR